MKQIKAWEHECDICGWLALARSKTDAEWAIKVHKSAVHKVWTQQDIP